MRRRKSYDKGKMGKIDFIRLFRGADAESWYMFSKTEKDKKFNSPLRIGVLHLFFEKKGSGKTFVQGTLMLEQDWNRKDLTKFVEELGHNFVTVPEEEREDLMIDVHFAKADKNLIFADSAGLKEKQGGL